MTYHLDDTIAAIATAAGGAARSMVRVSGPDAATIVERCFTPGADGNFVLPRRAVAMDGSVAIALHSVTRSVPCTLFYWPDERSYTREPVAEFHALGSPPLAQAVLNAVCGAGARLAESGEFTLRAFLAGRLDLTQAEAVLGVIDAHDASDLSAAVEQLAGNLARPLGRLREELLMLLAELEAGLDFVEEDIEFITAEELSRRLQGISEELAAVEQTMFSRTTANAACQIALVGAPNAGKSSLFNALVHRFGVADEATPAIVSDVRGTTRDYLVAPVEFEGVRCELVDTAGVDARELPLKSVDALPSIDALARDRAAERRERALLRVVCIDSAAVDAAHQLSDANAMSADLVALAKADLSASQVATRSSTPCVLTSSATGQGIEEFASAVVRLLSSTSVSQRSHCIAATADRCRHSIRTAAAAVSDAAALATRRSGDELVAAEIRVALAELGKVVGAVYTNDLLDRIFKTFCIGK
ncbi:MAG: tRNA modification GTPase [Pirellulales bacterium]